MVLCSGFSSWYPATIWWTTFCMCFCDAASLGHSFCMFFVVLFLAQKFISKCWWLFSQQSDSVMLTVLVPRLWTNRGLSHYGGYTFMVWWLRAVWEGKESWSFLLLWPSNSYSHIIWMMWEKEKSLFSKQVILIFKDLQRKRESVRTCVCVCVFVQGDFF